MSTRESNQEPLLLRLQGDRAIIQATDAARAFGIARSLAPEDVSRLCIVIEELIANLYDHGGVTWQDEVLLEMALAPNGVRVAISDFGLTFDPWSGQPPADSIGGAGAGIRLIRAWAERLSYVSSDAGNRLEFLLPIRPDAEV